MKSKMKKIRYADELHYNFTLPQSREPGVEPYPGGLRFEYPYSLEEQPLQALGLLDVTAAPFFADATGTSDSTNRLNSAIRAAQRYQLVCWFPLGIYLVSDTLYCQQYIWWEGYPYDEYRVTQRQYPCVLMGERREGADGTVERATIRLVPNCEPFTHREHHRPVIDVYNGYTPEANCAPASINNMITGLHIEVGEGNFGAIGVDFYAAQGCSIEDCVIDVGDGWCGIWGSAGNGGSHAQNTIRGGCVGIDVRKGTPGSVMSGFVLERQRDHAIVAGAKQAVNFVGCHIVTASKRPAVVSYGGTYELMQQGQVSLLDCRIEYETPAAPGEIVAAVSSRESVYLRNVYIHGASHAVCNPDGTRVQANPTGWYHLKEFAHGVDSMPDAGGVYTAPLYVDGERLPGRTCVLAGGNVPPPKDLCAKHLYRLPLWQDVRAYDVKVRYGAVGDGVADDTAALQNAIDGGEFVFLPKGYYRITGTLKLRENTKLVGVAQNLSQILVTQSPAGAFGGAVQPVPALDTPDIADADIQLAYCGIVTARELVQVYALRWRCGGRAMLRNFTFYMDPGYRITWITAERHNPWVLVEGNGGGRWYNFWCDITQGGEGYRILRVQGTQNPFRIYSCNVEHSRCEFEMDILGCRNIVLYNLKSECNTPDLLIKDSDNIAVFSKGGDASTYPGGALFHLENSTNVTVTLMNDYRINTEGHSKEFFSGEWFHPSGWHMLTETAPDGKATTTQPWERPALYKRGEFQDIV